MRTDELGDTSLSRWADHGTLSRLCRKTDAEGEAPLLSVRGRVTGIREWEVWVDFKQLASVLRRRWLTILTLVVLGLGASAAFNTVATKQYQSTTKIFISADVRASTDAYTGSLFTAGRVKSYADLANSSEVMSQVIDELGLDLGAQELAGQVTSSVVPDTLRIVLTVTDPDPKLAQAIARTTADKLTDYLSELETPAGSEQSQITATVTDPATFNGRPVSPRVELNLALAGLIGLVLGAALAMARDALDRSVRTMEHAHELTHAPVLASIAYDSGIKKNPVLSDQRGFSPRAEAFRLLRTNLQFLDLDQRPRSLVITSAVPGEGKTVTATNLAVALAQAGRRVVLVDGDLRRPRVAPILGLDSAVGLTTVLVGSAELKDSIQVHEPTGLHLLASGPKPPNPTEILQSRLTHDLMLELRDLYDMVIIDAPPLLPVADAAVLATIADGAIIVTRFGRTTREQLKEAVGRVDGVGGRLFGLVLNMVKRRAASGYYYHYDDAHAAGPRKR